MVVCVSGGELTWKGMGEREEGGRWLERRRHAAPRVAMCLWRSYNNYPLTSHLLFDIHMCMAASGGVCLLPSNHLLSNHHPPAPKQ